MGHDPANEATMMSVYEHFFNFVRETRSQFLASLIGYLQSFPPPSNFLATPLVRNVAIYNSLSVHS